MALYNQRFCHHPASSPLDDLNLQTIVRQLYGYVAQKRLFHTEIMGIWLGPLLLAQNIQFEMSHGGQQVIDPQRHIGPRGRGVTVGVYQPGFGLQNFH